MFKHSVTMKWSDEDKGFIATVPELPGLSAFGETQEEAISELHEAAEAYLEALRQTGQKTPAVEKIVPYSGQLRVRMPKSLHAKLAVAAESEGVSLNTYMVSLLSERHAEAEASSAIKAAVQDHQPWAPNVQNTETIELTPPKGQRQLYLLKSSTDTIGG